MIRSTLRPFIIAGLAGLLVTACAKPKKAETDETGAAGGAGAPEVVDRSNTFDSRGSDGGNIAGLNTVFFEYDQARLTNEARQTLAANAEWIKAHPALTVQIEGHTDARGSVEYNLSLGERRAKSVKTYLEGLGVEGRRMTIISYGEEKPLAEGDTEAAYSKNRRANFVPLQ